MKRTYLAVFEKGKDSWSAFAPDVPGTGGLGDTVEEARQSLREGIGYMLDDCIERGVPLPEAKSMSVDFSEFDPNREQHYEIQWLAIDLPEILTNTGDRALQVA